MRKVSVILVAAAVVMFLPSCGGNDDTGEAAPSASAEATRASESETLTVTASASASPAANGATVVSPSVTSNGTSAAGTMAPLGTRPAGPLPTPGGTPPPGSTSAPGQPPPAATNRPGTPTASEPVGEATLSVTSASGDNNQEVEVVLSVSTDAGIALGGWLVDIEFDPSVAQAESCSARDTGLCNEAFSQDSVRIVGIADDGQVGELGRITFRLTGGSGSSSPLRITTRQCIDRVGATIACSVADGTLRIN